MTNLGALPADICHRTFAFLVVRDLITLLRSSCQLQDICRRAKVVDTGDLEMSEAHLDELLALFPESTSLCIGDAEKLCLDSIIHAVVSLPTLSGRLTVTNVHQSHLSRSAHSKSAFPALPASVPPSAHVSP